MTVHSAATILDVKLHYFVFTMYGYISLFYPLSKKSDGILDCGEHSGSVVDSRPRGRGFEPHQRHCIVSLSKNINPSLVLVQARKTRPFITER